MKRSLTQVGEVVRAARERAPLTIKEAATLARISDTTWSNVEKGLSVSRRTQWGVCRALGWADESFDRLLDGLGPIDQPSAAELTRDELAAAVRDLTEVVKDLRAELRGGRR